MPTSLLAPVLLSQVLAEEQKLAAAAAAGLIVAQLERAGAPASSADGADLDAATRSAVRRAALEAVMAGRQVSARVVNVDEKSGRVVLSGEWPGPACCRVGQLVPSAARFACKWGVRNSRQAALLGGKCRGQGHLSHLDGSTLIQSPPSGSDAN